MNAAPMFRRIALIGFGLIGLQTGSDVLAHVDVGDVDRNDFERRLGIQAAGQHRLPHAIARGQGSEGVSCRVGARLCFLPRLLALADALDVLSQIIERH